MHQGLVPMLLDGLARTEQKFTEADDKLVPGYFLNFLSPLHVHTDFDWLKAEWSERQLACWHGRK